MNDAKRQTVESASRASRVWPWFVFLFLVPITISAGLAAAQKPPAAFLLHDPPKTLPAIEFRDGRGNLRTFESFRGKTVLLNLWATWCTPCRREMPTLDRLQAKLGGDSFEVVALSIDRAGIGVVEKFYGDIGISRLARYIDVSGKAVRDLGVPGLPTTLLIDAEGREIGRLVGPAEWDSPEMIALIQSRIAKEAGK